MDNGESYLLIDPPNDCRLSKVPKFASAQVIACPEGKSSEGGRLKAFRLFPGLLSYQEVVTDLGSAEGRPRGCFYHSAEHDCYCVIQTGYKRIVGKEDDTPVLVNDDDDDQAPS